MKRPALPLAIALACIAVPGVVVIAAAVSHYLSNRVTGTIAAARHKHPYVVHVPRHLDRSKPVPLVLSLHGGANWPAAQMHISGWNRVADRHGFIVAYPGGEGGAPRVWDLRGGRDAPHVRMVSALIDRIASEHRIDPARIYVNGLSQGASMSFVVSCALSHRIAAVGFVAAAHFVPVEACRDGRPIPMISFHGTDDGITGQHGGRSWVSPVRLPNIYEWTAAFAKRNGCAMTPAQARIADDVTRIAYGGCAGGASVVLHRIEGGGHTWPGGMELPAWFAGSTPRSIDASEAMWEFFRGYALPGS